MRTNASNKNTSAGECELVECEVDFATKDDDEKEDAFGASLTTIKACVANINGNTIDASALRNVTVMNTDGNLETPIPLTGDKDVVVPSAPGVTVLLVFCKTRWRRKDRKYKEGGDIAFDLGVADGGEAAKISRVEPERPGRERIFVDNSKTFEAYKAVGFGKLTDADASTKPKINLPVFP